MAPRILIIAAPFGFGPSSKALILAKGLSESSSVTINIDGDASEFVEQFKAPDVALVRGRFSQAYGNRDALAGFDLIVSINHVPALATLERLGLLGRTIFFDSLFQWRSSNTKDSIPSGLLAFLVQDYPGIAETLEFGLATHALKVAPLLWPSKASSEEQPKQGLTLHLGGLTSPLAGWRELREPVCKMVMGVYALARQHRLTLTVLGNQNLKDLDIPGEDLNILGSVSPEQSIKLFAASELVITTPGIGAIYESLANETPVVLLPPLNSTQFHHFRLLTTMGFPCSMSPKVREKVQSHINGKIWEVQTKVCLSMLRANANILLSGLAPVFRTLFDNPICGENRRRLIERQFSMYRNLSKLDAVDAISGLAPQPRQAPASEINLRAPSTGLAETKLHQYCRELPKVELHVHMEGSISPELMLKMARRNSIRLPFSDPAQFKRLQNFRNFREFANLLLMGVHCLRQRQDFFELVVSMGAQMAAQNVVYAEVTWTPQFYLNRGIPLDAILDTMNEARHYNKAKWGVEMRWIPDIVRSYPQAAWTVAKWACGNKAMAGGVVALGLSGPEESRSAGFFAEQFSHARSAGLPANPHAGEGSGPESIAETLDSLQPSRLGHGVRAVESTDLISRLVRDKVALEVCPTSNIKLGVYGSYGEHPLKTLVDAGCRVTINSDDPVLFATNISREYEVAVSLCGLPLGKLKDIVLNAAIASYLPEAEKQELLRSLQMEIAEIDRRYRMAG
jgi:adenosine deaminase